MGTDETDVGKQKSKCENWIVWLSEEDVGTRYAGKTVATPVQLVNYTSPTQLVG